jgi:hypothetical protein
MTTVVGAAVAVMVRVQVAAATATEAVPRFESVEPSQAANVNESLPTNPTSG